MFAYEDSRYCIFQGQMTPTEPLRKGLDLDLESPIGSHLYTHALDTIRVITQGVTYVLDLVFNKNDVWNAEIPSAA